MTPKKVAAIIGCSVQHIGKLIRNKKLKAKKVKTETNRHGYLYQISESEVSRYQNNPPKKGRPQNG